MAYSINLECRNTTAAPLRALCRKVSEYESSPSVAASNYCPHVTLCIFDHVDPQVICKHLCAVFSKQRRLILNFCRLRFVNAIPGVVWIEPDSSFELHGIHSAIHERIDPQLCRRHYRPGHWIPHCTLGYRIATDRRSDAQLFASHTPVRFQATFDTASCVSSHPIEVIRQCDLQVPLSRGAI